MALPKSAQAYRDCYELFDKAQEAISNGGLGMRLKMESLSTANHFRMRMNQARVINRRDNTTIYNPGDPLYQASVYDTLVVRIKLIAGEAYIYVEQAGLPVGEAEAIPEDDNAINLPVAQRTIAAQDPPRQLTYQPLVTRR